MHLMSLLGQAAHLFIHIDIQNSFHKIILGFY